MASTLSELREALGALGVSTATGSLRGEERRAELLRRLHAAQGGSKLAVDEATRSTGKRNDSRSDEAQSVEQWSLSELRQALEARGLPTLTPGLKGDARRHALVQRLLSSQNGPDGNSTETSSTSCSDRDGVAAVTCVTTDEDDAQSVVSGRSFSSGSSVYSTAREFLFFDMLTPTGEPVARPAVPTLQLPASKHHSAIHDRLMALAPPQTTDLCSEDAEMETIQDALFERRQQLHALRKEQQRQVEASLERAGISQRLEVLSSRLEALAHEKQRLESSCFGHELVTSHVLGALSAASDGDPSNSKPRVLELVQQDALELIRRHQRSTRQLIDRTKQAVAIVKTARRDDDESEEASATTSSRESALEREIRELEAKIQRKSALSSRSSVTSSVASEQSASNASEQGPVLTRCRSVPHSMFLREWKQLTLEQRQQLHAELRHAASFHIKRDRVCIQGPHPKTARPVDGNMAAAPQEPSRADRLGVKARFLEVSGRTPLEIHRAYQAALAEDPDHVQNLVHYASFLAFHLCNKTYSDQVEQFLQRAIAVEPTSAHALSCYARFLSRVRTDATNAAAYFDLALKHLERDDTAARADIIGEYVEALLLPGTKSDAAARTEALRTARELSIEALEAAPSHLDNQRRLLQVLCELGDVEQAEQRFRRLVSALERRNQQHCKRDVRPEKKEELAELYRYFASCLSAAGHSGRSNSILARSTEMNPRQQTLKHMQSVPQSKSKK